MYTKLIRGLILACFMALAGALSGCADDGGNTIGGGGNGGNNGNASCESDDSVLDGAQCSVTELVDDLGAIVNGTPLEPFIQCVDPLGNDLVDGPDSVLNTLLVTLATQSPDPAAFTEAIMDLATALASLGENLPNALLALSGDDAAIAACVEGSGGDADPAAGLAALCAIPALGPALVGAAGGTCEGGGGGGDLPLSPAALCAVPVLGPLLVDAVAPGSCGGTPGDSPLPTDQLAALCAIPVLGPALVESINPDGCGDTGGGGGDLPLSPAALCAVPVLGPTLVESIAPGSCSGTPSDSPLPTDQLAALCAIPVLGPALVDAINPGGCGV